MTRAMLTGRTVTPVHSVDRAESAKDFTVTLDGEQVGVTDFEYEVDPVEENGPIGESPPATGTIEYHGWNRHVKDCVGEQLEAGNKSPPVTLSVASQNGGIEASVFFTGYRRTPVDDRDGAVQTTVEWMATSVGFIDPPNTDA